MVTITKNDFILHQLDRRVYEEWRSSKNENPSDFYATALKWVGDAIRGLGTQTFWVGGAYCWYSDDKQTRVNEVFVTDNGIACYIDDVKGCLYRIEFK